MRIAALVFAAMSAFMVSCGPGSPDQRGHADSPTRAQALGDANATIPGADSLVFTDTIRLKANENMHFDHELFKVRAGQKLGLIFTNTGAKSSSSMAHNVVILRNGTDLADFADIARTAKAESYVPASLDSLVIAHTKLVAGGGADTLQFVLPRAAVYDFICSFPGHWGTMQGKIVAK